MRKREIDLGPGSLLVSRSSTLQKTGKLQTSSMKTSRSIKATNARMPKGSLGILLSEAAEAVQLSETLDLTKGTFLYLVMTSFSPNACTLRRN